MNQSSLSLLDAVKKHGIFVNKISSNLEIRDGMSPLIRQLVVQAVQPLIEQDCILAALVDKRSVDIIPPLSDIPAFCKMICRCAELRLDGHNVEMVFLPRCFI